MDKTKKEKRRLGSITWEEREEMIQLFLTGNYSKAEIWQIHNISGEEKGNIVKWMRRIGYDTTVITQQRQIFPTFKESMTNQDKKKEASELSNEELQRINKELQKKLEYSELEKEAYRLTIEIAEKELKIPIRKKSGPK